MEALSWSLLTNELLSSWKVADVLTDFAVVILCFQQAMSGVSKIKNEKTAHLTTGVWSVLWELSRVSVKVSYF